MSACGTKPLPGGASSQTGKWRYGRAEHAACVCLGRPWPACYALIYPTCSPPVPAGRSWALRRHPARFLLPWSPCFLVCAARAFVDSMCLYVCKESGGHDSDAEESSEQRRRFNLGQSFSADAMACFDFAFIFNRRSRGSMA